MSSDSSNDFTDKVSPPSEQGSDATRLDPNAPRRAAEREPESLRTPRSGDDRPAVERIGDFRIVRELGRGGMGVVFEAVQESLGRRVALKILPQHASFDPTSLGRFRREAEAAGKLDHPGLCTVYGTGSAAGMPYIVMRYIEGESLARRILLTKASPDRRDDHPIVILPSPERDLADADQSGRAATLTGVKGDILRACLLIERAARAVHHAHEVGVIHRDLKPANIMVTPDGKPVILDFGLAGDAAADTTGLTQTGDVFGTPAYMAPEQCRGDVRALDRRADVYSLGVTLFESLTLKKPFEAPTRDLLVQLILTKDAPDARIFNSEISEDLSIVIATALEKNADRRYLTAFDFAEDLRRVRMFEPIRAKKIRWPTKVLRWSQRNRAMAALLFSLAVGIPTVAALAGVLYVKYPEAERERLRALSEKRDRFVESGFDLIAAARTERDARLGRAKDDFAAALKIDPDCPEAIVGDILVERRRGHHDEVVRLVDAHAGLADGARGAMLLKIDALETLGRAAEALALKSKVSEPESALDFALEATVELERTMGGPAELCRPALRDAHRAVVMSRFARPLYYYLWARSAGYAHDKDQAAAASEAVMHLWPSSPRAFFYAGYARQLSGDYEGSLDPYRRAIVLEPGHLDARYNYAHALHALGRLEEAAEAYRMTLEIEPEDYAALNNLGAVYSDLGRVEDSQKIYEAALIRYPDDTGILANAAQTEILRGRLDHAEELLERARAVTEKLPNVQERDPGVYSGLGALSAKRNDFGQSAEWLAKASAISPENPDYRMSRGYALFRAGDRDAGLKEMDGAAALPGRSYTSSMMYAEVLSDSARNDDALAIFAALEKSRPDDYALLNNYGNALEAAGKHEKALPLYARAIVLAPKLPQLHVNTLDCCEVLADAAAFIAEMERFEKVAQADPYGWSRFIEMMLRLKREEPESFDAKLLTKAADRIVLITDGKDADALFLAARSRRAAGDTDGAIRDAEKAIAVYPPDEEDGSPGASVTRSEIERFLVACRSEKR